MADKAKKLKAAMAAVSFILQEEAENSQMKKDNLWVNSSKRAIINGRELTQRRGRLLRPGCVS